MARAGSKFYRGPDSIVGDVVSPSEDEGRKGGVRLWVAVGRAKQEGEFKVCYCNSSVIVKIYV
jgi:hypothetical protein